MKRFMMLAALFGAMTLGACVDNEESQSVTDIRDAKTEELKSLAALNNAQAEAEKTLATAEAALKTAEAARFQAEAEKIAAEIALLNVQKEIAEIQKQIAEAGAAAEIEATLAEAQARKAQAEAALAEANANKAITEANLAAALANAEAELLAAQATLAEKAADLEDATKVQYQALLQEYTYARNQLNQAMQTLANKEIALVNAENGLLNAEEFAAEQIEYYEEVIERYNEEIAVYEAMIEAYANLVAEEDVETLLAKANEAIIASNVAYTQYRAINTEFSNARNELVDPSDSEWVNNFSYSFDYMWEAIANGNNLNNYKWLIPMGYQLPISLDYRINDVNEDGQGTVWGDDTIDVGYYVEGADPEVPVFVPLFTNIDEPYSTIEEPIAEYTYEWANGETVNTYKLWASVANAQFNAEGWAEVVKLLAKNATEAEEAATEAKEAYEKADEAYNGEKGELAAYNKALETYTTAKVADDKALAAIEAAQDAVKGDEPTEAEAKAIAEAVEAQAKTAEALAEAEEALNEAREAKDAAAAEVLALKNTYKYAAEDAENAAAICTDLEAEIEGMSTMHDEWVAANDAYYADKKAIYDTYWAKERAAWEAYSVANTEATAARDAYYAVADPANGSPEKYVANYKDQIELRKGRIENCEEQIEYYKSDEFTASREKTIAAAEQAVADAQLAVDVLTKQVEEAKAKLDAILAE